jgi:predicted dehydrogenase
MKRVFPASASTSRRQFCREAVMLAGLGTGLDIARSAHAAGSDILRIGFVGCGNRGSGACKEALSTKAPVKLVAIGDLFADRIETSLQNLRKYDDLRPRIDVPDDRKFVGFDAYQRVIEAGVDLVLLTTPPHFRPLHYAAAVQAGKHAFLEKPCCVDAPGYRLLVAANEEARRRKLSVVVGLQRRHQRNYREGIQKIRDGAIGDVQFIRTYFNMNSGGRSGAPRPAGLSEMEFQIRHWGVFCWLCGDHLVEQATHEIDVANWAANAHPIRAQGMGGREVRVGPNTGDIWDHHSVQFEFPSGAWHFCEARQQPGTWVHVSDNIHGTKGMLTLGTGPWGMGTATPRTLRARGYQGDNPYQTEHDELVASIRGAGPYVFDGDHGATSSMTAVMGRMATYSGQLITWDEAIASEVTLAPKRYALDADPPTLPDAQGNYTTAKPGVTRAY